MTHSISGSSAPTSLADKTLLRILREVREQSDRAQKSLVVFDLDSTLFDVSPRLLQILTDFADDPENQKQFPEQVEMFKDIKTLRSDWGIENALVRVGLDGHHAAFQEAVKKFWLERFFSNHYLQFDQPYEGAIEYVQALYRSGAQIAYLTGRDVKRMGDGTIAGLVQWQLPLSPGSAELALKPDKSMDDALFKKDWFADALTRDFNKIYFFENEPVNIHLLQKFFPQVEVIFFASTHAGKAEPPVDIPHIMNFLCNLHEDFDDSKEDSKSSREK